MAKEPQSAVFTTVLWDGGSKIADFDLHLNRLKKHAKRLRITLPNNLIEMIIQQLTENNGGIQLLNITYDVAQDEIRLTPRQLPSVRNCDIHAMTLSMNYWVGEITGTKHGDWQPYLNAKTLANDNDADLALLIDEYCIIDSDRANLIVIDEDGVAYATNSNKSVEGVTQEILTSNLEKMGIPLNYGKLNERLVARCSEMIAVGVGLGCCRVVTIDGESIGHEHPVAYPNFVAYLAQHYSNSNNWVDLCELPV